MSKEQLDPYTVKAREIFRKRLPSYIRKLKPLPEDIFPDETLLDSLTVPDNKVLPSKAFKRFLHSLKIEQESQWLITQELYILSHASINGVNIFDEPVTIGMARRCVAAGLLEYIDGFSENRSPREGMRILLGL